MKFLVATAFTLISLTCHAHSSHDMLDEPQAKLELIDTKVGKGKEAFVGKSVTLHYTGWLYDASAEKQRGKKFDSSGKQPFVFPLGDKQVIRGWDEGIVGMKAGGKRTLIIPAEMAYGARGARDGQIPPNSTLIFDVELLAVK